MGIQSHFFRKLLGHEEANGTRVGMVKDCNEIKKNNLLSIEGNECNKFI